MAYVVPQAGRPPTGAAAVSWAAYFADVGGLVAHGVRGFHFQAGGGGRRART
ncbi:hypothetical protein [Streptomyces sp. G-G2]|uniref:hypothetical protein n=1 Tax=Streptomyces sp. G-G2 TaxID=3046201 RepID=UPI0024BB18D2|nr:hypothetical protein [Streptomyces sp. G-G2]MDJ0386217.1 hypothetical protein [Streptomyces sp. G-G2]